MLRIFRKRAQRETTPPAVPPREADEEEDVSDVEGQDDPAFLSPLSNDDFTCNDIAYKSSDREYCTDQGLDDILQDMKRCIAYETTNELYFIKILTTDQTLPHLYSSVGAEKYLKNFVIEYTPRDKTKTVETNLWSLVKKYAVSAGLSYTEQFFYNYRVRSVPSALNVFFRWKYRSLPKSQPIDMKMIRPFFSLCEDNIFPSKEYCNRFYSWVAMILQYPGSRNEYGYLISGKPATGKSTLIEFIAELTAGYSIPNVSDLDSVFGKFNSQREYKVFIGINDFYCSESTFSWNMLKTVITEDTFECRAKGKDNRTAENVNNLIIATNTCFLDVEEFDRRWQYVRTKDTHRGDKKYFEGIRAMLHNDAAMQMLHTYFMRFDLSDWSDAGIIPDAQSTQNGIHRFVDAYKLMHARANFTMTHLETYWDLQHRSLFDALCRMPILETGEPTRAIYAQFVQWARSEGIKQGDVPQFDKFKEKLREFENVSKASSLSIKGKGKITVFHLKL